jgi:predicted nucleic acid-binding protein
MVVVADTSPLNYLVLIGEIQLLPQLYRRVVIPQAVIDELRHPAAPAPVAEFAANPPDWLEIARVDVAEQPASSVTIATLDAGEIAAITLAAAHPGALLLMDETAGRAEAARRGIRSTGTLGILRDAAAVGFVDLPSAFQKLQATSFRLPTGVITDLLEQDATRKERL